MIAKGLCSVLASDYYYPAQLLAAFRLVADGVLPLTEAWNLVSAGPAQRNWSRPIAACWREGRRADILLVDDSCAAAAASRRGDRHRKARAHLPMRRGC